MDKPYSLQIDHAIKCPALSSSVANITDEASLISLFNKSVCFFFLISNSYFGSNVFKLIEERPFK